MRFQKEELQTETQTGRQTGRYLGAQANREANVKWRNTPEGQAKGGTEKSATVRFLEAGITGK